MPSVGIDGDKAMNSEYLRWEMDADEYAEYEAYQQARREEDRD